MITQHNKHRSDIQYAIGDLFFVKLQPYCQRTVTAYSSNNFCRHYFGPFEVSKRIGAIAYCLQLPPDSRIHNVFHVSLLRPFHGASPPSPSPLLPFSMNVGPLLTPSQILDSRTISRHGKPVRQHLVAWCSLPAADATWEDADLIDSLPADRHLFLTSQTKSFPKGEGLIAQQKN